MAQVSLPPPHPDWLPPGTQVGNWRVVGGAGRGVYGAVYQAVPVGSGPARYVALKLAVHPGDPRFAREVELLSRLRHPSIPRLEGAGEWRPEAGAVYPYIAMEWVQGEPLYFWARQARPSARQVLGLLAQLARALQALHALGAVHRDVKGDNVLVRRSDGRAMLTDLGSGNYPGAATLTPPGLHPGTPVYRAPEAWLFELRCSPDSLERYEAGPGDDLYALGVTGCQLLTGEYPKQGEPRRDESGTWRAGCVVAPAALARVAPPLRELILRLLSVQPEERGTAARLAEALEQAAESAAERSAQGKAYAFSSKKSSAAPDNIERVRSEASEPSWLPRLSLAAGVFALAAWAWWITPSSSCGERDAAQAVASHAEQKDAGTSGLGEAAAVVSAKSWPGNAAPEVVAEEKLPEPIPGQTQPNSKGRCPHKKEVALNGGCWVATALESEECELLHGKMFRGTCYMPVLLPSGSRMPTSCPTAKP